MNSRVMVAAGRRLQRWKYRRLAERVEGFGPASLLAVLLWDTAIPTGDPKSNVYPRSEGHQDMTVLDQAPPTEAVGSAVQEPASEPIDSEAVVAVVMDFVGATHCQLDHLLERMRLSPCGPGVTGSLFQWSRRTLDGVRVTEVWQSRQYFEITFREEIQPRLSEIGLPHPEITTYEVHSFLTQGPIVAQQARGVDRQ
jgi:hypothetical protein